jgi:hypothetical protein
MPSDAEIRQHGEAQMALQEQSLGKLRSASWQGALQGALPSMAHRGHPERGWNSSGACEADTCSCLAIERETPTNWHHGLVVVSQCDWDAISVA